jgi:cobalt-precorrin-5B (C1)-methyltransferase
LTDAEHTRHPLRSGFTTGACAAAAAKGATLALLGGRPLEEVDIPFPAGFRHSFSLHTCMVQENSAYASVIKDAGDDPDVTNGAEIMVQVQAHTNGEALCIQAGPGVGTVTKPGLALAVGEPAINPGPQRMIRAAVQEALHQLPQEAPCLTVTISVRNGEQLAEKTLNRRLGILGGLSILGTTGIVWPVSAAAWTATIEATLQVARAAGLEEVLLSTGRSSEAAVQRLLGLPEEAQVMMGDYLAFTLKATARHGFKKIHLAGMWGKVLKCALGIPQTHVRHGVLDMAAVIHLLEELGLESREARSLQGANTALEILHFLSAHNREALVQQVCIRAKAYAETCSGLAVTVYLVHSERGVIAYV